MSQAADVTSLLVAFSRGDRAAGNAVIPLVYEELRRIARRRRGQQFGPQSPGTTSLVHEVYFHLVDQTRLDWGCRAQFFYFASVAIRNLLVDHARRSLRQKRSPGVNAT